jgi:hypothetical protein
MHLHVMVSLILSKLACDTPLFLLACNVGVVTSKHYNSAVEHYPVSL